ncbi:ABC transporter substrate-binding protein [Candidatus Raskinella chloraquaticus]|uniref:Peptide ABC transporter substrate-binding protein n=1 Tax=Candidatus Raskinella chloraquaticus TaxID=1951219 RepID=A0A1W9HZ48_9HYPH|nr:MAG: peptide ABC transporter substrate-binding protein [Proteobacteria bacterium SG_bin8]
MRTARFCTGFLGVAIALSAPASRAQSFIEPPMFEAEVTAQNMPPVAERLPMRPRVINLGESGRMPGRYGGTLRMLIADQRDIRLAVMYSYARLVTYNTKLQLEPDILDKVDIAEGRIFTLHIRPGHRWSDGQPFTSEDFRYFWEDVANNPRLSPGGPPLQLRPLGRKPKFEVIDALTVRYTWDVPNPGFLPALAAAQPVYIYMPAHYMRQFHTSYAEKGVLDALIKKEKVRDWEALHERKSRQFRPENPALPSLDPWRNTTPLPSEVFVFERNPYYHRVDENGRQLPYIDNLRLSVVSSQLIPAKVGAGDSDLQARYLRFDNFTFLKVAEKRNGFLTHLWRRAEGSYIALQPNLNASDPVWRSIVRDVRFRRALSLAVDRRDINQVIFFGLARESAMTVMPESPLYDDVFASSYARFDPLAANRLLDEMGLKKRDFDGIRFLPDGRRAEIIVESAGESMEETDALELVVEDARKVGLRLLVHSSHRDVFRRRISGGSTVMSVRPGIDNGLASPDMDPQDLSPTNQNQFNWPMFGQWVETNGKEGQEPDMEGVKELVHLRNQWLASSSTEERRVVWKKMLSIHAEQLYSIGIISGTLQPVVVSQRLRNVPATALYAYEPGGYFGLTMPDSYWFDQSAAGQ